MYIRVCPLACTMFRPTEHIHSASTPRPQQDSNLRPSRPERDALSSAPWGPDFLRGPGRTRTCAWDARFTAECGRRCATDPGAVIRLRSGTCGSTIRRAGHYTMTAVLLEGVEPSFSRSVVGCDIRFTTRALRRRDSNPRYRENESRLEPAPVHSAVAPRRLELRPAD